VFPVSVLLAFLVLAALYESWVLPLAVILIVPMCMLSALVGVKLYGSDNNTFVQVGLVVLMGLACKNAILIVEFARELESQGKGIVEAALEACRLRLRPIVMTSVAFIAGTIPLVLSHGAGAEVRSATGITVFAGMIGVTLFGLFLTPVFYVGLRKLSGRSLIHHGEALARMKPTSTRHREMCSATCRRKKNSDTHSTILPASSTVLPRSSASIGLQSTSCGVTCRQAVARRLRKCPPADEQPADGGEHA
jgi:predicted RND superfamily exporter protein